MFNFNISSCSSHKKIPRQMSIEEGFDPDFASLILRGSLAVSQKRDSKGILLVSIIIYVFVEIDLFHLIRSSMCSLKKPLST